MSDEKVRKLRSEKLPVEAEVVEGLERLLAEAKRGEIIAVCFACESHKNVTVTGRFGAGNRVKMLGSIDLLKARILKQLIAETDASDP